ncbi:MAG TPA: SHOCT domain-containing protein [Rubrobacter sp.]|nr:SHOCT domain-containing protein [Rubrobacter sp.]
MHEAMNILTEAWSLASLIYLEGPPWDHRGWDGPGSGGSWWPWILFPILFWGGILSFIAWIVTRLYPRSRDRSESPRDSAEEILRERFARGEITADEYERSLDILRGGTARRDYGEDQQPGERES